MFNKQSLKDWSNRNTPILPKFYLLFKKLRIILERAIQTINHTIITLDNSGDSPAFQSQVVAKISKNFSKILPIIAGGDRKWCILLILSLN